MPNVAKKEIVDKVIERLQTIPSLNPDLPGEALDAFKNPFREVSTDELPCFKVGFVSGNASRINNAIEYEHSDELIVAYIAQGNGDDLQDALYDAMEIILDFLIRDENNPADADSLHHLVSDLIYTDWSMDMKTGEVGSGAIVLKFNVVYHTRHEITGDDFTKAYFSMKPAGASEETPSIPDEQLITLPQS